MGGAGGLGVGCQWLAGLVCRVCLCAIWMVQTVVLFYSVHP